MSFEAMTDIECKIVEKLCDMIITFPSDTEYGHILTMIKGASNEWSELFIKIIDYSHNIVYEASYYDNNASREKYLHNFSNRFIGSGDARVDYLARSLIYKTRITMPVPMPGPGQIVRF